jgi:hypothetical protein
LLVGVVALAAIVASAGSVVMKDYPARLAVDVEGVPGYVYYDRSYDITVEYANLGGPVSGPVELAVELPATFALADRIGDPAKHGERLVWILDGLDTGERGSVTFALQGTLPADLTEAVYDLPGYAGHTAFVEGFELAVTLTAGSETASTLAVADTGEPTPNLTFEKVCATGDTGTGFVVNITDGGAINATVELDCGETEGIILPPSAPFNLSETQPDGYLPPVFGGDCAGGTVIILTGQETCTVTNLRIPTLTINKTCVGDDGGTFNFELTPAGDPAGPYAVDCAGTSGPIELLPDTEYTLEEVGPLPDGWTLTGLSCQVNGGTGADEGGAFVFTPAPGGTVTCTFTNTFTEDPDDGTDGVDPACPICCPCGLDVDIDINNDNNNVIGIDNDNTNDNANDNANDNDNENANENENDNENENTQNQTNDQDQNNTNDQTNNIDSSPEVNISGSLKKPAPAPTTSTGGITPPSTGDAGLSRGDGVAEAAGIVLILVVVAGLGITGLRAAVREG